MPTISFGLANLCGNLGLHWLLQQPVPQEGLALLQALFELTAALLLLTVLLAKLLQELDAT